MAFITLYFLGLIKKKKILLLPKMEMILVHAALIHLTTCLCYALSKYVFYFSKNVRHKICWNFRLKYNESLEATGTRFLDKME